MATTVYERENCVAFSCWVSGLPTRVVLSSSDPSRPVKKCLAHIYALDNTSLEEHDSFV